MQLSGSSPLHVTHLHAATVADLPHHHRDPFDRLLVAQARVEDIPLLTSDPQLTAYGVPLIAAS
jgi:PIN domain nuclease of toxin-antitoxin system